MGRPAELTLKIEGMHCAGCVQAIESSLGEHPGISGCRVNLATRTGTVVYDRGATDEDAIVALFRDLGYSASPGPPDILQANLREETRARRSFQLALLMSLPLVAMGMWPMLGDGRLLPDRMDSILQAVLATLVLFIGGRDIIADAARQTRRLRANMNSLIAMGTLTAFGWSTYQLATSLGTAGSDLLYYDSVGMIVTLILLGRFLEVRVRGNAGQAIKNLLELRPSKTVAIINDVEIEMEASTVQPGMVLLARPSERLAADGEVLEGTPAIDESMLTGESLPVEKRVGDEVIGGSVNGTTSFRYRVTSTGEESFLGHMIRLVSEAQGRKAPMQQLTDRVAGIFVPVVIMLAFITLAAWMWLAPDDPRMIRSVVSILIIACPCALGLATPTAVMAGTGRAAREGIIIKGGDILENLTRLNAVVFDKTGTLTHGELEVAAVKSDGNTPERELIRLAGSVERHAEHPLARAIVGYAEKQQIELAPVANVSTRPGFGLAGEYRDHKLILGNRALMVSEGVEMGGLAERAEEEMKKGRTVVLVALEGKAIGLLSLTDRLRSDARDVVGSLIARLDQVTMLSGDTYRTAASVAGSLGLKSFEAEVRPGQKQLVVESFRKAGYRVAMIGDGTNDAPALAAADVGVAIGSGTDIAMEAAGVVLVRSDLSAILRMFEIARLSMRIIRQNLFWAFAYNIVAIPLAAGALYPFFGLTLSPAFAAGAMAFSSILVVTNSLRLSRLPLN